MKSPQKIKKGSTIGYNNTTSGYGSKENEISISKRFSCTPMFIVALLKRCCIKLFINR
jgi:hypothetical protein